MARAFDVVLRRGFEALSVDSAEQRIGARLTAILARTERRLAGRGDDERGVLSQEFVLLGGAISGVGTASRYLMLLQPQIFDERDLGLHRRAWSWLARNLGTSRVDPELPKKLAAAVSAESDLSRRDLGRYYTLLAAAAPQALDEVDAAVVRLLDPDRQVPVLPESPVAKRGPLYNYQARAAGWAAGLIGHEAVREIMRDDDLIAPLQEGGAA